MRSEAGDKVRIKAGDHSGERGLIKQCSGDKLVVQLEESGQIVRVDPDAVTNYSLAARKAWVTEPDRAVGRRKGTRLCDRVSVTLRIDRELWQRFLEMEKAGQIEDRTAAINNWLRQKLSELDREERQSSCPPK